ncbi:dephospho-CoA kinase [Dermatophilus congolensis]|uniref:dephospho-CoA kinase n=1 Tax=Dermatophilus congolensis TaxID=1863 RepID=UPI001AAF4AEF|nr:dephospho-CoA kinase [Dermatophilus congolensis]MBO3142927.1 dephospho-CoA kinase [Dermatophilus congolensis]MBO3151918.1 dephospho-CoA kinase [Dermatophilus congolensis]MBO3161076.1 dephospho-CoA kinase [Dermatophilus congolensis]MBO3163200.1 dephospho-CoA kinase [Dermatophilus congolensis]MBO3176757.1 dephospho-CoA kinase [Dermatophilus congolensis]
MVSIGLTGGIGSGKSTVATALRARGAVVVDADAIVRDLLGPGGGAVRAVVDRFGDEVVGEDGAIDRAALAATVFQNAEARNDLEAIVHPLVAVRTTEIVAAAPEDSIIVHDVPLLVEKHMGRQYHLVLVVHAPAEERARRLVEKRGMSHADAMARMSHQADDDARRAAADVWLDNSGTEEELLAQVEKVWEERIIPFRDNLIAGRIYRPENSSVLVEYDEQWPAQAARIIDRLSAALGDKAPEFEHVGSTAVPGMEGKNAIDIQVGVRDLREADDPEFVRILTDLGYPRVEEYRLDHPTDDLPDPSLWIKRFHGSSDPGQVVHLHVREIGSAGWQYALLFRDWLRGDPGAAEEYVEVKATVDAQSSSVEEYRRSKAPWFNEVWPRIQAWARKEGWQG